MLLAVDVDYRDDGSAVAAGIVFRDWPSGVVAQTIIRRIDRVENYQPGEFYRRELPCILTVISAVTGLPEAVIVDGYVSLGANGRDGLGMYLYRALEERVPVIGVAKNRFRDTPAEAEVLRGTSIKPLYVTSSGMDVHQARANVATMHGAHRIPTILSAADRACRQG